MKGRSDDRDLVPKAIGRKVDVSVTTDGFRISSRRWGWPVTHVHIIDLTMGAYEADPRALGDAITQLGGATPPGRTDDYAWATITDAGREALK